MRLQKGCSDDDYDDNDDDAGLLGELNIPQETNSAKILRSWCNQGIRSFINPKIQDRVHKNGPILKQTNPAQPPLKQHFHKIRLNVILTSTLLRGLFPSSPFHPYSITDNKHKLFHD
jgi:hypothetical protein